MAKAKKKNKIEVGLRDDVSSGDEFHGEAKELKFDKGRACNRQGCLLINDSDESKEVGYDGRIIRLSPRSEAKIQYASKLSELPSQVIRTKIR